MKVFVVGLGPGDLQQMTGEALAVLEPVSYTHLDVYKRQGIYTRITQSYNQTKNAFIGLCIVHVHWGDLAEIWLDVVIDNLWRK